MREGLEGPAEDRHRFHHGAQARSQRGLDGGGILGLCHGEKEESEGIASRHDMIEGSQGKSFGIHLQVGHFAALYTLELGTLTKKKKDLGSA